MTLSALADVCTVLSAILIIYVIVFFWSGVRRSIDQLKCCLHYYANVCCVILACFFLTSVVMLVCVDDDYIMHMHYCIM